MQNTIKLREVLLHQSLNRPNLVLGGDRELVLVTIMVTFCLAFSLASWWGVGLSVVFWMAAMAALQRMGKADPLLRHVYLRHIGYRGFYPAKSGLYSRAAPTPMNWR